MITPEIAQRFERQKPASDLLAVQWAPTTARGVQDKPELSAETPQVYDVRSPSVPTPPPRPELTITASVPKPASHTQGPEK